MIKFIMLRYGIVQALQMTIRLLLNRITPVQEYAVEEDSSQYRWVHNS